MSAVVNVATPSRTVRNHGRALIDSHAPDGSVHGSRDNFHHPDAPDLIQRPNHNQLQANLEQILGRKAALNALTGAFKQDNRDPSRESHKSQQSLSAPTNKMNQMTPMVRHRSPPYGASAASVGDIVSVGGGMTGTVRFVGKVKGKDDTYAGVELDPEFSTKGKNSGNANGTQYFDCIVPGSGVFIPVHRAVPLNDAMSPTTPDTVGYPTPTHPTLNPPSLRQPISSTPRAMSPQLKKSRPSLPRPESPIRRLAPRPESPTRKLALVGGMPVSRAPTLSSAMNRNGPTSARAAPSPTPGRFGSSTRGKPDFSQSVNGLAMGRKLGFTPKSGPGKSYGMETIRAGSALEIRPPQDEGDELGMTDNLVRSSGESYASGSGQSNARGSREDHGISDDGAARYRTRLLEQDKQLKEQAQSLAEMEASLAELYARAPEPATKTLTFPTEGEDGDVLQLRRMLREKNEKIAILSAEFDSHRADFRSTIDTLELASSETERVYERRVKELEAELDAVSKKNVGLDVGAFTKQMRQLEDLVQELEEGLEDARRGEAEARGEVEFLRGEVERGRSELRRERELAANLQKRNSQLVQEKQQRTSSGASLEDKLSKAGARESKEVEQKDDEIRGLKAIIHSLSRDGIPDSRSSPPREGSSVRSSFYGKANGVPKHEGETLREKQIRQKHEREVRELRNIIDQKTERETEMDRESETLKRANMLSPTSSAAASTERGPTVSFSTPTGHTRKASLTPMSNHQNQPNMRNSFSLSHRDSTRDSKGTTVSWRDPTFETNAPPEGVLPRPPSFPNGTRLGDVAGSLNAQQDRQASRGRKGPTFAEKRASVLNGFTAASSETEFEPDNISGEEREGEEGTDVEADGTPWCEICEAKGHDILSCGMFTGGAAGGGGVPSGHAERTQNGATSTPPPAQQQQQQQTPTHVRQPSAVPMALKTSASKGSVHTPELPQAGPRSAPPSGPLPSTPAHGADQKGHMEPAGVTEEMVAGKSSGRVDPGKWCALCEKDGHDSVDCPAEMDF